jgi:ribulose-5-phosphate 4-epimerase/fuculose-1-phosphate aldolase
LTNFNDDSDINLKEMKFKVNQVSESPQLLHQCNILAGEIIKGGHEQVGPEEKSDFVLNLIELDFPKAYRRKGQEEMVVSIALLNEFRSDMKSACYAALVKSISNMLFCIVISGGDGKITGFSITPEVGFTEFAYTPEKLFTKMYPVISSHFVLKNRIYNDLVLKENQTIPEVEDIVLFARELDKLGVLPAPFPLTKFLDQDLIDHLFRLYQIRGLSYGNLSIRNKHYDTDGTSFWMTARGVDKSQLKGISKDIILVKGYDRTSGEMLISVPPEHDQRVRVSVDAIEHYLIYDEFPGTGAIVHVHAWIDDVLCSTQTYPCGTRELAEAAVELLKNTPVPERAEIGLKNHGLTITGPDIRDIFDRIRGRLKINVPMFD